ncbi:hypothetical protein F5X98DRAFT_372151 [Xylaria grammica]|nr:hypothetical protein F5X98DRAFT_372151 [Xylaria grammica]
MASQEVLQNLHERDSTSSHENVSRASWKHTKAPPPVDVELAQSYRDQQDLPPIKQDIIDPELHVGEALGSDVEYVEILLDKGLKAPSWLYEHGIEAEGSGPPRDYITGRIISDHGRTCLRCTEKGLRCTLNFVGKEAEPQCAACRRSKEQYCVRFQSLGGNNRVIPFNGPPWKNPNFVAGSAEDSTAVRLPREQLENILHEFYDGNSGYVLGNYVAKRDVRNYALPPFNGVDLSPVDRPENYRNLDWKDILPDWKNQSLRPRQKEGEMENEREKEKKRLAMARDRSLLPIYIREGVEELNKRNISEIQTMSVVEEEIDFLRALRRYQPREQHLSDCV